MDSVVQILIPAIFLHWKKLFSSIDLFTMTFDALQNNFGILKKKKIESEISCLWQAAQYDTVSLVPRNEVWINERVSFELFCFFFFFFCFFLFRKEAFFFFFWIFFRFFFFFGFFHVLGLSLFFLSFSFLIFLLFFTVCSS